MSHSDHTEPTKLPPTLLTGLVPKTEGGRSTHVAVSHPAQHVLVKLLDVRAALPGRGSEGAAAVDLCVWQTRPTFGSKELEPLTAPFALAPGAQVFCGSGLALDMTGFPQMCALILPRSGLGTKGLNLANTAGLIDNDYQGHITMALVNNGNDYIEIKPGMRVAQLMFMHYSRPPLWVAGEFPAETARGAQGYGSTGA